MAQVQYNDAPPSPLGMPDSRVPDDYQRIQSSPAMFGAGIAQGEQQLGQGFSRGSEFFGQVAADDATNQVHQKLTNLMYGEPGKFQTDAQGNTVTDENGKPVPDGGFLGMKGGDAMTRRATINQDFDQIVQNARNSLSSPEQQLDFDKDARRYLQGAQAQVSAHADQQADVYARDVNAGMDRNGDTAIARDPANDAKFQEGLDLKMKAAMRNLHVAGMANDPEAFQAAHDKVMQDATVKRIDALLPVNPPLAQQVFEQNRGILAAMPQYDALSQKFQNFGADDIARKIIGLIGGSSSGSAIQSAPPMVSGGGWQSVDSALTQQESGNNPNVPNSISGAVGAGQIMPATFQQYATPGEDINNSVDNANVRQRIVQDLYNKTGGDPARIAVGYFSGPGNIAPAGSPTPWLKDASDPTGKTTSSYVSDVMGRLGGNAPNGAVSQATQGFPARDDLLAKIPTDLPPEQYDAVSTKLNRYYNQALQATSADRAQVEQQYKGGLAMLQDGRDFSYDPNKIKSLFPPDVANQMIGDLQDAKTIGQASIAVRGMSLDDIQRQMQANDQVLSNSTGEGYSRQAKLANAFNTAAQQHFKQLAADPAAYVQTNNSRLASAYQAASAETPQEMAQLRGDGMPTAGESYAAMMQAEQTRLGVPDEAQSVLSKTQAINAAQQIMTSPDAKASMDGMALQYGAQWPRVMRDLVRDGELPGNYEAVDNLDPTNAQLLARALNEVKPKPDGTLPKTWDEIAGGTPGDPLTSAKISAQIRDADPIPQLASSWLNAGASASQVAQRLSAIDSLAMARKVYLGDQSPVQSAIDAFTKNYIFLPNGGARVPIDKEDAVTANAENLLAGIKAGQIAVPPSYGQPNQPTPQEYAEELKAKPTWRNSPDDKGIMLYDKANRIVRDTSGKPVMVPFDMAAPAAPAVVPMDPLLSSGKL
jgi:hypothetical protein